MYLDQSTQQYKNFQDFEKYAKFICEKFDINIQLESTRAETDGRTIFLPNVMSMTSKELDMMYSILLHEAGHIRYSTFDDSYFNQLKSKAHAFLANSIEDARIENLLMIDFDGAKDMFETLYCDFTQDKVLMKKVFKHDGTKPDLFAALAFHVHNELINCKTSSLKEIAGARMANRINKFWKEHKIADLLANNPLKGDKDVIGLTNTIYDLFVLAFKVKDTSEKIDFSKELAKKKEIEKKFNDLREEAQKVEKQVAELTEKYHQQGQEVENFDKVNGAEMVNRQSNVDAFNSEINRSNELIDWKESLEKARKTLAETSNKLGNLEKELQKQQNEKTRLEEMLKSGVNGRKKELNDAQKEALKKKIEVKDRQIERATKNIQSVKDSEALAKEVINDANFDMRNNPSQYNENIDVEKIKERVNALEESISQEQAKINELYTERNKLVQQQNETATQINKAQDDFMDKSAETMFELDKSGRQSDFDLGLLPELNYENSWPEAAAAQEKFDADATKKSGKIVRNGQKAAGMFGSNVRDIITFIDKKKENIAEIDVTQIFKNKIGISKLDDFNSDVKQTNFMDDKSVVGVFGTRREHIPSTTVFDSIKKENTSRKVQEYKELMAENAAFYRDLKRVFARKFKFAKKDMWKGGQEEGSFDVRNLWKLPTNQGNDFYEITNPKFVNKVAATILVDLSGSQNKEATQYGKNIRALVLGLSQALDEVHIKHEVLGFHAPVCDEMREMECAGIYTRRSNRLETVVFKESGQKDHMGLMNIEPQMTDNSDGESLRIAIKRLKAIRAKSHMIFIISDGKPFLCDTDVSVLDEDYRAALRLAVREKVQVFGLGYFDQLRHFLGERFCKISKNIDILKFFEQTRFQ